MLADIDIRKGEEKLCSAPTVFRHLYQLFAFAISIGIDASVWNTSTDTWHAR